jgi:dsDNA-binding SOS-regulon protein
MNSGPIQQKILDHIDVLDKMLEDQTTSMRELKLTTATLALLQAKSDALIALSNTKAQRI